MSENRELTVYFAAALFSQAERAWNAALAARLEARMPGLTVILPQSFEHEGTVSNEEIFRMCLAGLERADMVVAILDGQEADSGTCLEVGYARGRGKPVIGVRTDFRQNQDAGLNVMLRHGCTSIVTFYSFNESVDQLAGEIVKRVRAAPRE